MEVEKERQMGYSVPGEDYGSDIESILECYDGDEWSFEEEDCVRESTRRL